MKCKIYPNYIQEYQLISDTCIKLVRRIGAEIVYTDYLHFDLPAECTKWWENESGA